MIKKTFIWIVLAVTLVAGGCGQQPPPEESCNFVQNQFGRRVSWARMPIQFYTDQSISDKQHHEIIAAMKVWNDHFDRPVFELIGRTSDLAPPKMDGEGKVVSDGYNGIYMADPNLFENSSKKDEQARTSISFRGDFIFESDILIDSSESFFYEDFEVRSSTGKVHFKSLMIHELGHALGLGHIEGVPSVMDPKLQFGQHRIEITEADFESLSCEYQ